MPKFLHFNKKKGNDKEKRQNTFQKFRFRSGEKNKISYQNLTCKFSKEWVKYNKDRSDFFVYFLV